MLRSVKLFLTLDTPAKRGVAAALLIALLGGAYFLFFYKRELNNEEKKELVARIIQKGNIDACARAKEIVLDGVNYETVCRNNVAYQLAFKTLDPKYCKDLDNKLVSIEQCEAEILLKKINTGADIAVCSGASVQGAQTYCRGIYWFREAIQKGNEALCDTIEDVGSRAPCHERVAIEGLIKNPSGTDCSRFSGSLARDCENFKSTLKSGSQNSCTLIGNERIRSECMGHFSKN